jgi:hypothetical protein
MAQSVSGPFIGLASKPDHGLYWKATPSVVSGKLRMELLRNGRTVLVDVILVPKTVTKATVVDFFGQLGPAIDDLRKSEAAKPGSITVRLSRNDALLLESSLTDFEAANADARPRAPVYRMAIAPNSQCSDNCDADFQFCSENCDPRGGDCGCHQQYSDCLATCPTCNDWEEVGRTKIGGAWTGAVDYFGLWYCQVTSYYIVEQHNMADCYPNRFVCDTSTVTFFFGNQEPNYSDECCNYTQPQDISHSDYCGGDTCN